MEWSSIVAIYAAAVSSLTAAWNVRTGLRDRGHLKLELRLRKLVLGMDGTPYVVDVNDLDRTQLALTATNVGRRPLTLTGWTGQYRRPQSGNAYFFVVTRTMPKQLGEGQQCVEFLDAFAEAFEAGVLRMFVTDSTGHQWQVSRRMLKAVVSHYRRLKASEGPSTKEMQRSKHG